MRLESTGLQNIVVVAKREYLQRIKGKGFWLATLGLPLFVAGVTILPSLFLAQSEARQRVVIVDETGRFALEVERALAEGAGGSADGEGDQEGQASKLGPGKPVPRAARFEVRIEPPRADRAAQRADLDRRVLADEIDAWIWIDEGALAAGRVPYHARSVSNFLTQDVLKDGLSAAVRRVRLRREGLDPERIGRLTQGIRLDTVRVSREGSRAEGGLAGAAFAYILFMMLYVAIAVWGQQVMTGILEEKSSRIVEVLISTMRPFELLMGKLAGICLLGLTQIGIWVTTMVVLTAPGVLAAAAILPAGTLPTFTVVMALHFAILFALGFFLFSSFYAAVGAAFNNLQEAQQVAGMLVFVLVLPVFIAFRVINDPGSQLAVTLSLIPVFTPLLMALRIAIQMPPLWQILLSYVLTGAFVLAMVWASARVYRVGILMYGKKPTLREIVRWVRYA